jgi:hypothetical protein
MAKTKKPLISKTESIRQALANFPDLGPKEVAEQLTRQGLDISAGYVSTVKASMKRKKRMKLGGAVPSRGAGARRNGAMSADYVAVSVLLDAKELIAKAGGVAQAREAIDVVAQLT